MRRLINLILVLPLLLLIGTIFGGSKDSPSGGEQERRSTTQTAKAVSQVPVRKSVSMFDVSPYLGVPRSKNYPDGVIALTADETIYTLPEVDPNVREIPADEAAWEVMWSPLRDKANLYIPYFEAQEGEGSDKVLFARAENGPAAGNSFMTVYTDPNLLNPEVPYIEVPIEAALLFALYEENTIGIIFNSESQRYASSPRTSYAMDKMKIAALIGYLKTEFPKGPHVDKAKIADAEDRNFEALFHSMETQADPALKPQLADVMLGRVKALIAINYPGAATHALNNLAWYEKQRGNSSTTIEYRQKIQDMGGPTGFMPR